MILSIYSRKGKVKKGDAVSAVNVINAERSKHGMPEMKLSEMLEVIRTSRQPLHPAPIKELRKIKRPSRRTSAQQRTRTPSERLRKPK